MSVICYSARELSTVVESMARKTGASRVVLARIMAAYSVFNTDAFNRRYAHHGVNAEPETVATLIDAIPAPDAPLDHGRLVSTVRLLAYNLDDRAPPQVTEICGLIEEMHADDIALADMA